MNWLRENNVPTRWTGKTLLSQSMLR